MNTLPSEALEDFLRSNSNWQVQNAKLYQKFIFKNFSEAFQFMTNVATLAEQANHHPEWKNVYNIVEIWLITHDASGITEKDLKLAKNIQNILIERL